MYIYIYRIMKIGAKMKFIFWSILKIYPHRNYMKLQVYIYICIYVYIYIYIYIYIPMNTLCFSRVCTCQKLFICMYIYIDIYLLVDIEILWIICTYIFVCKYIYVHKINTYLYIFWHLSIYIYTNVCKQIMNLYLKISRQIVSFSVLYIIKHKHIHYCT
jgi:hypothetical protein